MKIGDIYPFELVPACPEYLIEGIAIHVVVSLINKLEPLSGVKVSKYKESKH
jgi:hypothetical protein